MGPQPPVASPQKDGEARSGRPRGVRRGRPRLDGAADRRRPRAIEAAAPAHVENVRRYFFDLLSARSSTRSPSCSIGCSSTSPRTVRNPPWSRARRLEGPISSQHGPDGVAAPTPGGCHRCPRHRCARPSSRRHSRAAGDRSDEHCPEPSAFATGRTEAAPLLPGIAHACLPLRAQQVSSYVRPRTPPRCPSRSGVLRSAGVASLR